MYAFIIGDVCIYANSGVFICNYLFGCIWGGGGNFKSHKND